ncbi:MAG: prepilin peptidase [Candidatus Magasanikbacteria bacterium]
MFSLQILFFLLLFVAGLVFGSFLNALEWRLHEKKSLNTRSECPKCHKMIGWYDNVPIFSFLFLRGKCRHCHEKISWQYPIVELLLAFLFCFVFYYHLSFILIGGNFSWLFIIRDCLSLFVLLFIFIYDTKYMEVSDIMTLGSAGIIFVLSLFLQVSWLSMLIGAMIGSGFFLLQFVISKGKWIGGGDIRIGLLMGIILGWKLLLLALWLAYIIGGIVSIIFVLSKKKKMMTEVAFGNYLSLATFIAMFFGTYILDWYFRLIF